MSNIISILILRTTLLIIPQNLTDRLGINSNITRPLVNRATLHESQFKKPKYLIVNELKFTSHLT